MNWNTDVYNPNVAPTTGHFDVPLPRRLYDRLPDFFRFRLPDGSFANATKTTHDLTEARGWADVICGKMPPGQFRMDLEEPIPEIPPPEFSLSTWIDVSTLLPSLLFDDGTDGLPVDVLDGKPVSMISESRGSIVWRYQHRVGRLVWHASFTFRSLCDYVEFEIYAVHSDPRDEILEATVASIILESQHPFCLDQGMEQRGATRPRPTESGRWKSVLVEDIVLADGQCTPIFRGALLCLPDKVPVARLLEKEPDRVAALVARASGKSYANLVRPGDGGFTSLDYPPFGSPTRTPRLIPDSKAVVSRTAAEVALNASPFWQSFRGLEYGSNQPGGQYDFGLVKGEEILTGRFVELIQYLPMQTEMGFRPAHFREVDGTQVLKANHPDWWTYQQRTHFHPGQSPDRLGKPTFWPPMERNGWGNTDDQHLSWNTAALIRTLIRSDATADLTESFRQMMLSAITVKNSPSLGRGGIRAIGRRLSQASLICLHGDPADIQPTWETLVLKEVTDSMDRMMSGLSGPVRPQEILHDPRRLRGVRPGWNVWEHGLLANGIAAAIATEVYLGFDHNATLMEYGLRIAELVLAWGTYEVNGALQVCQDVGWVEDGQPINYEQLWGADDTWVWKPEYVGFDGWTDWIFPGILWMWREGFLDGLSDRAKDAAEKLEDSVNFNNMMSTGVDRESREWFPFVLP